MAPIVPIFEGRLMNLLLWFTDFINLFLVMATTAEQFSHQVYGLIGFPLVHSFSKDFFNQKFESEGIDAEYLNFEIDDISKIKNILIYNPHLKGLNVTAPYKKDIIPYLDSVTPEAERIGAVNVVKILRNKEVGTVE